jgi:nucleotide-binding universal stress UspA family protein
MSDLIIGYDASECSKAALDAAITLARALGDRIIVAYAEAPPDSFIGDEWKVHRQALGEIGQRATSEALDRVRAAGIEVEVELVTLKPAHALLAIAERRNARMIVVGTHGEGPIAGALLGSVPHKLLHRSRIPVLVVPAYH